jgi:hypothetical protein
MLGRSIRRFVIVSDKRVVVGIVVGIVVGLTFGVVVRFWITVMSGRILDFNIVIISF